MAQLARSLLLRLEQPHVFDGDGGLIGERHQKSDVLLLEWSHLGTADQDGAKRAAFADQRYGEDGTMSPLDRHFPPERELRTGVLPSATWTGCRSQMERPVTVERSSGGRFLAGMPPEFAERRGNPERLVIDDCDIDNMCLANAGGVLGYRVKHWLHVTWRIGDYAENVADRRLLLQRLVTFADDPRDLCFVSGIGGITTAHILWRIAAL